MNLNTAELERLIPGLECGFNDDDDSSPTNTTISCPEHEFVKYTKVVQTGKTKGQTRHCVSLAQHLYMGKMLEDGNNVCSVAVIVRHVFLYNF